MPLSKKAKTGIQYVVMFSIGILLVWLVSRQVADKKDKIIDAFKNANYFWVVMSCVAAIAGHILRAYRWNYLLEPIGHKARFPNALGSVFIGYLVNYGIPRAGELMRCTLIARYDKIPFEKALGTVITERIVDFVLLILVFALTMLFQFSELFGLSDKYIFHPIKEKLHVFIDKPVLGIVALVVVLAGIAGLFLLRKRIGKMLSGKFGSIIKGFGQGLSSVKQSKHKVMFSVLSLAIWATYLLGIYFCFFAFKETSHLGIKEGLVLLLFGTFGVIFTPGGLGAYHAIITAVLGYYAIDDVTAFAFPWLVWSTQLIVIVIVGGASFVILPIYNKEKNVAQ
jgi:hypothetical protein